MTWSLAILIACAVIAICMRIFKLGLIVETFASTATIVLLAFYPFAHGLDKMDWVDWIWFAVLMTLSLLLHVINVFLLAEKKN